jgi:arginase
VIKTPHFFKAHCRLGCTNFFFGGKDTYLGVEAGPDAILTDDFLKQLPIPTVSSFTFPNPEEIDRSQFIQIITEYSQQFKNFINKNLTTEQIQIMIGGDHSLAFSSILATLDRLDNPKDLGYIQFDSHGDMNLFSESPTKNFHGMYLRPLIGDFDIPQISRLVDKKILAENMIFIGNLDLDPEEKKFFKKTEIKNISRRDILNDQLILNKFKEFIFQFKYLHVSLDVDVFDQTVILATGLPCPNGLMTEDVLPFLEVISKHPNFSFDLVEVNPKKPEAQKAIKLAQKILQTLMPTGAAETLPQTPQLDLPISN